VPFEKKTKVWGFGVFFIGGCFFLKRGEGGGFPGVAGVWGGGGGGGGLVDRPGPCCGGRSRQCGVGL